jgi:hypothetical protein
MCAKHQVCMRAASGGTRRLSGLHFAMRRLGRKCLLAKVS